MTAAIETVKAEQTSPVRIKTILRKTAAATNTDFNFLLKVAERESSLRADARASTSSASGLFQFIEQTWLEAVKKHGSAVGLKTDADAIKWSGSSYAVASQEQHDAILNKRFDPEIAAKIAARTFRDTADALSSKLGREMSNGELYLAHFLGANGAVRMLEADGRARAADIAPAAARANEPLFYKNGAAVSVDAFRKQVMAEFADAPANAPSSAPMRRDAPLATIRSYGPPMASPVRTDHASLLPMSVFREILELESVRQFSTSGQDADEETHSA